MEAIRSSWTPAPKLGAPIVTTGGAPVTIETTDGPRRAIVIRDPDGYMVRVIEVFRARHVHLESQGNAPVWLTSTSYNVFIEDPNGMNLELSQTIPLEQQKPGENSAH